MPTPPSTAPRAPATTGAQDYATRLARFDDLSATVLDASGKVGDAQRAQAYQALQTMSAGGQLAGARRQVALDDHLPGARRFLGESFTHFRHSWSMRKRARGTPSTVSTFRRTGSPVLRALPARLQSALEQMGARVQVRGLGVLGDTTAGGLARVDRVPAETRVCVVALGGNDLLQGVDPDRKSVV